MPTLYIIAFKCELEALFPASNDPKAPIPFEITSNIVEHLSMKLNYLFNFENKQNANSSGSPDCFEVPVVVLS